MAEEFTVTRIKVSTLESIRKMADAGHRSPVQQIDLMTEVFENINAVDISALPHPEDAQVVPVISVSKQA